MPATHQPLPARLLTMPITFKSKHSPNILMLEQIGQKLLRAIGHSGTVPGSLAPEDLPAALARLLRAMHEAPAPLREIERADDDDDDRPSSGVTLAQRAGPLVAMLETAIREGDHIIWER